MMLPYIAPPKKRTAQKTPLKGYFSTFYAILCRCTNKRQRIVKKAPIYNARNSKKKFQRTILGSIIKTSTIVRL
jgi:hypothetical protein